LNMISPSDDARGAPDSRSQFLDKPTVGRLVIRPATRVENRGKAGAA
jgi:hypothetical protein